MPDRPRFVSFLSDYGRVDEFVGVCHAVMLDIAPEVRIVDITHDVTPFDVRAGALALVRAVQYLPEGVVLAIVDPGVGTDRRCIAVEVENGFFVGPDNGLLAPAVAMADGARRVDLAREHRLPAAGAGSDLRGSRRDGARGRAPRRGRGARRPRPRDRSRVPDAGAVAAAARRRGRHDRRRGVVGRPFRQPAAEREPRRAHAERGRSRHRRRGSVRGGRPPRPPRRDVFGGQTVGAGAARRLLRLVRARVRSQIRGRRARVCTRASAVTLVPPNAPGALGVDEHPVQIQRRPS